MSPPPSAVPGRKRREVECVVYGRLDLRIMSIGRTMVRRRLPLERGASLVEYALLVALIAVVCFAAVTFFGTETGETFSEVGESVGNL